jgi:hypothetical protein
MLSHFNRGQKTTPTSDVTWNFRSGLPIATDGGNDCSYNLIAFPPSMEVRSAGNAGEFTG